MILNDNILKGGYMVVTPKVGVPFWGSHNKDYSILGTILGSPYFGNYHMVFSSNF